MNVAFIVPTGLGAEIGGHAGDANPAVKLIGKCCDKLITHPNAVNASDINEMPENALYVEGSILDRFLRGEIRLKEVYQNKILLVVNGPIHGNTINSVSAARTTIGATIEIMELNTELKMTGFYKNGKADGKIEGWEELVEQINDAEIDFDVLCVQTKVDVDENDAKTYLENGGINPWGGVEAKLSKRLSNALDKPVIHSPLESGLLVDFVEVVDPRLSAEMVSVSYSHCMFKGAHKAPKISYGTRGLSVDDIDFLISPDGCVGEPHYACMNKQIPIIVVRQNKTVLNENISHVTKNVIYVENYLEAAGVIQAYKAGVSIESVLRPIKSTKIIGEYKPF